MLIYIFLVFTFALFLYVIGLMAVDYLYMPHVPTEKKVGAIFFPCAVILFNIICGGLLNLIALFERRWWEILLGGVLLFVFWTTAFILGSRGIGLDMEFRRNQLNLRKRLRKK